MPLPNIPNGIETQADAAFDAMYSLVDAHQANYIGANPRYWQGLRLGVIPANGNTAAYNKGNAPADRPDCTWDAVGIGNSGIVTFEVHEWQYKQEQGWKLFGFISLGGVDYYKYKTSAGAMSDWLVVSNGD